MSEFKFALGRIVRDKISSFAGTVTAECRYIDGPNRYMVTSMDGSGKYWFSEERLELGS